MMMVGLVGGMKTAFVSTGGMMIVEFGSSSSWTCIAALTAVPLMISTMTGLASLSSSKIWGKRPVYLTSLLFIVIGCIWNTTTGNSYKSCMGARIFQGIGWGAFETLVLGSIQDTYFVSASFIDPPYVVLTRSRNTNEHCAYRFTTFSRSPLLGALPSLAGWHPRTLGPTLFNFASSALFSSLRSP